MTSIRKWRPARRPAPNPASFSRFGPPIFFVAAVFVGYCCCGVASSADGVADVAADSGIASAGVAESKLRRALERLREGEDGRGGSSIDGGTKEVAVTDQITLRIGSASASGFRLMDLIAADFVEDGKVKATLRFPQLVLSARIEVFRPSIDAAISGEAILRFLDVEVGLEGNVVVREAAPAAAATFLARFDVELRFGAATTAFDLSEGGALSPGDSARLQADLKLKREVLVRTFQRAVEMKIRRVVEAEEEGGRTGLAKIASASASASPAKDQAKVEKSNRLIDQILADNRKKLEDAISVVKLPDEYFPFKKEILWKEIKGFARLDKGRLDNLHAISRKGDCVVFTQNDELNVIFTLGLDNVLGGYFIEVEFGYFHATSNLKLKIVSAELVIHGRQSFRDRARETSEEDNILNFDLKLNARLNLGDIDVDVNIFSPLDWLLNLIAEKVVSSLKSRIQGMIKDPIKDLVKSLATDAF